jgi:co-chaperonin GroES (HSP10)
VSGSAGAAGAAGASRPGLITVARLDTRKDVEKKARARMKVFTIKATMDNVVLKRIEEKMTASGLIMVKTEQKFIPSNLGLVMAVGPGRHENGVFVPTKLQVGDKVWFHLFPSGCEVFEEHDDKQQYVIIAEKQCVGVVVPQERKAK